MATKEVLKELIEYLFEFENQYEGDNDYSITDFLGFLNANKPHQLHGTRQLAGGEEDWVRENQDQNTEIARMLVFNYRYASMYFKKALKESNINTLDEFSFLIVLMTYPFLTKTELISKLIMEKTSGVEVIKRLLKQDLIREFDNPNDKRSIMVAITDKGREELSGLLPKMGMVGNVVVGNLRPAEASSLSFLLNKLDYHHNDLFMNYRNMSLEELSKKSEAVKKSI
ncbi:winged helix DNA-binding protein [Chryseobacterium sp. MEBOG06]|uniref:MarR family winged helix-turn-helix transcriptional regulator n=1 Tax=Chryseobacterium sp. MEBOG06 TaxID=2879938 RepID=UPI001F010681|nr:winged helix DNA-binding protein [Chryseobacterium sp. MEBOG06]UKB82085.1 winged helix DNA-binding protein [Chryseobacterium sp. MEBOG06]